MDSKVLELLKQKLERYRKTLGVARMMEFEKAALPPSVVATGQSLRVPKLNFSDPTRAAIERGDISFFRECFTTFNELDPDEYYENLIKRSFISREEFLEASNRFSTHIRSIDLQDKANNLSLAVSQYEELARQPQNVNEEDLIEESQGQIQRQEEEQQEQQEDSTGSQDTQNQTSPRFIIRRSGLSPKMEEKLNKANRSMQDTKKKLSGPEESRPQPTQSMEDKLSRTRQSIQRPTAQPATETPRSGRMNQRLNAANRSMRRTAPEGTIPGRGPRPGRSALINSRNRRAILPFLRGGASSGSGILGQVLQWGLDKLAWNLARPLINTLTRAAAQLLPRLGPQAARAGMQAGARLLLLPQTWVIIGIIVAVIGIIAWIYSIIDANSECGQPGRVILNKTASKESFGLGEEIKYTIVLNYNIKCTSAYLDKVTVKDTPPSSISYQTGSAKSTKTMEIIDPAQIQDATSISEPGSVETPPIIDTSFPAADNITLDGNTIIWQLGKVNSNYPITMTFSAIVNQTDTWVANQATVGYTIVSRGALGGSFSDITGLLPNPLTPPPADWTNTKSQIIAAYNKHPELLDIYKQAASQTGIPWQILAGLHFVEAGSGPGPDSSLVSGRKIGQVEPDIDPKKCANGITGPGTPIPLGGGCGFSNQLDSAIYAANHLAEKINKVPSTFPEAVQAMSMYNGGGNANCGEGLPYGFCPPQFKGEDDPYAMADFDEAHSHDKMYKIYCFDRTKCSPAEVFGRPGAMGVVRALIEEGL